MIKGIRKMLETCSTLALKNPDEELATLKQITNYLKINILGIIVFSNTKHPRKISVMVSKD